MGNERMSKLRVVVRIAVIDEGSVLLVKNKGSNYWYLPGGGWDHDDESLEEAMIREVYEETGYKTRPVELLWVQEFRDPSKDVTNLEVFYRAVIAEGNAQTMGALAQHKDIDASSNVDQIQWFDEEALRGITVKPERVRELLQPDGNVVLG